MLLHDACIGIGHILLHAILTHDTELPGEVIELTDQLDTQLHDLRIGSVGALCAVLAALAAGLLQGCNGRCCSNTGTGAAGAGLRIAAGLSQLLDDSVQEGNVVGIQGVMLDTAQGILVNIAGHIHKGIAQVQELRSIDATVLALVVPGDGTHLGILNEAGVQQVDDRLGIPANIHIAIAAGATLNGIKGIKYIRILAVVIKAGNGHRRLLLTGHTIHHRLYLVLGSIDDLIAHISAVLQSVSAVHELVVVDLNDRVLVLHVHMVIVKELGTHEGLTLQVVLQVGVELLKHILVAKFSMEEVTAALDILDTGLPVDVQQINTLHADVTQAVELALIPNNLVDTGAGLQLLPHSIRIGCFVLVLLQDAGDNGREHHGLSAVGLLPGQNIRLRVCRHGVRMLADDDIVQPAGHTGKATISANAGDLLLLCGIAQLPPVFGGKDSAVGLCLACMVLLKHLGELLQLLCANRLHTCCVHCLRRCRCLGLDLFCRVLYQFHGYPP